MKHVHKEFVGHDDREHRFSVGNVIASALSGFVAGAAVATIIFLTGIGFSTLGL